MTKRIRIDRDERGFPVLRGDRRTKPERRHVNLSGLRRLLLVDDDGRTLGPAEALEVLLSDGPLPAPEFDALASQYADPEVIYGAAEQLGVIRKKREDGSIEVLIPAPEPEQESVNLADDGRKEPSPMGTLDYTSLSLTPLREAQELLGNQPVIGSGLEIVKGEGRQRFVRTNELRAHLSRVSRGGKSTGAGEKIANALGDAQARRAKSNAKGQANDAHRRRYGTAKLTGRD